MGENFPLNFPSPGRGKFRGTGEIPRGNPMLGWLANTDVSPSTSIHAIVNYVSKYCSKAEKKSVPYKELLGAVVPLANDSYALASIVNKFLNKLVGEQDWSAQEVCHLLLDLPLSYGSR